ncbi:unnamed protein product [Parascedosporium putredinis]|uniref:Conserved oligomeric Golgi complex subunit 5 n=1 Tax=Parascedosporium putredinis TaxID=1442378 RepID=A0A9P1GZR8_9PEZI|nr:unnamed protein product [Parascedosporium putredinis]CAI7992115.1 unnamed protein product [Parascedosporium putredinis]
MATEEEPSYIDYDTFLDPDFNPKTFANSLVLLTNNANDLPLDLSTPLSKVLFDIQEIDSHIDVLTTKSAVPLLKYTRDQNDASGRIISELDQHIKSLNDSYRQLEKEVIDRHAEAEEVRVVATRLWESLRLARSVSRCLQLGRQLEVQHAEISGSGSSGTPSSSSAAKPAKGDHKALVRCAHTILLLREVLERNKPGEEGHGLDKVDVVRSLKDAVIAPIERAVRETAERILREFNVPGDATFNQADEARSRLLSSLSTLYLLSPMNWEKPEKWTPKFLLQSLEAYLRASLQASATTLARARPVADVGPSSRRGGGQAPNHPLFESLLPAPPVATAGAAGPAAAAAVAAQLQKQQPQQNLLQPLLGYLETGSLASYYWRTLASNMVSRVQELSNRGGVVARTLKTNRANVGDAIRECVIKGSQTPRALLAVKNRKAGDGEEVKWDREIAVMVGSVVNNLGGR